MVKVNLETSFENAGKLKQPSLLSRPKVGMAGAAAGEDQGTRAELRGRQGLEWQESSSFGENRSWQGLVKEAQTVSVCRRSGSIQHH